MLQQLKRIKSSGIEKIDFSGNFDELNPNEIYWLEIKSDDRQAVVEYLRPLNLDERITIHIREPEISSRVHLVSGAVILNLPVSKTAELGEMDYLTVFVKDYLLITVINENNTTLDAIEDEILNNPFDVELSPYLVMYFMASEILQKDMEDASALRKRVNELTAQMEKDPEAVPLDEIIHCRTDVSQVSNIVEDQYYMLSFTPKLNWTNVKETENVMNEMKHLFLGFDYLQRNLERQEDKLEGLHMQYQSILQEKGNKRLNILTIVQAIFVPLTLIAGIYGMNFINMPELNWTFSYFIVLGIMGLIILTELWWFKKRGWFD
jgi:magnesium transporter